MSDDVDGAMTIIGIFAGGFGKRLMPLTAETPKSLVEVFDGKNILDLIIHSIEWCGISDIYLMLGAHSEKVISRYGNGIEGMTVHYLLEDTPMGTLHAFKAFCGSTKGDALLMNGDIVSEINMGDFLSFSQRSPFIMDMVVKRMRSSYGIVNLSGERVVSFEEKPILPVLMNAGIYHFKGPFRDYARYGYDGKNVEETVFTRIAKDGMMGAYHFDGFHASLDGFKDLEEIRTHLSYGKSY
jgi:NDP-sugar pyrophosphorylase family protein